MEKSEVIQTVIFSLSENIKYKLFFTNENITFSNIHIIVLIFPYIHNLVYIRNIDGIHQPSYKKYQSVKLHFFTPFFAAFAKI